jgi:hypothetical protein
MKIQSRMAGHQFNARLWDSRRFQSGGSEFRASLTGPQSALFPAELPGIRIAGPPMVTESEWTDWTIPPAKEFNTSLDGFCAVPESAPDLTADGFPAY